MPYCLIDVAQSSFRATLQRGAAGITLAGRPRCAPRASAPQLLRRHRRVAGGKFGAVLALLIAMVCGTGCSSCEGSRTPSEEVDAAQQAQPPATVVPAPAGVIAELTVARPEQAYRSVRQLVGASVQWMPSTFPMLAATGLGLSAAAAAQLSGEGPLVGVLAERGGGGIHGAIGMALRSGDQLIASLTTGQNRSHVATPDAASGVTVLSPIQVQPGQQVALGVLGGFLLAASSVEDLKTYGPYVAHTLPARKLPTEAAVIVAPKPALAGPLPRRIRQLWAERRKGLRKADQHRPGQPGRQTPDLGDPATALLGFDAAVQDLVDTLQSARRARFVLEPYPDRMETRLEVEAEEQGAAAELISQMALGDLAAFVELPVGTVVGVSARNSRQTRTASARSLTEGLANLLGGRLADPDRDRVLQTLVDLAEGRGDHMAYGVLLADTGPSVVMRGQVDNPQRFDRGVRGLFRLLRLKAIADTAAQFVGEIGVRQKTVTIPGVEGPVQQAQLSAKSKALRRASFGAAHPRLQSVELLWRVAGGVVQGSAGREARSGLVAVLAAAEHSDRSLASDRAVASAAARAGDAVSFALLVQPLALGLGDSAGTGSAPVLLTVGRTGRVGWLRADVHPAALRAVLPNRLPR